MVSGICNPSLWEAKDCCESSELLSETLPQKDKQNTMGASYPSAVDVDSILTRRELPSRAHLLAPTRLGVPLARIPCTDFHPRAADCFSKAIWTKMSHLSSRIPSKTGPLHVQSPLAHSASTSMCPEHKGSKVEHGD